MKITICGSIAFYPAMLEAKDGLVAFGHEVQFPELAGEAPQVFGGEKKINFDQYVHLHGGIDAFPVGHEIWDLKEDAINHHFSKIEWADAILVVNEEKRGISGYIGGNTLIEIGVAFYLKKPIYLLHPVSSELSSKQEICGMKPILLDGRLELIDSTE